MITIKMPQVNTNDEKIRLVEWFIADGAKVESGQSVALLETSKSTEDLIAESGGILKHQVKAGEDYICGEILGMIFENEEQLHAASSQSAQQAPELQAGMVISKAAQKLIDEKGITSAQITGLGKQIIRESDILALLENATREDKQEDALTKHQRAVARIVSRSHQEIPAAFMTMRIYCDGLLDQIGQLKQREGLIVGIPEIIVYSLACLQGAHSSFYGKFIDDAFVPVKSDELAVSVTFDMGHGLFLPSTSSLATRSLKDVIQWFGVSRMKALRNNFKGDDLKPGDIALSINADKDVEFVVPFILPPQVCIFSMGSIFTEWSALPSETTGVARRYFLLGLAYDHRVNNGWGATQFMKAMKQRLEGNFLQ